MPIRRLASAALVAVLVALVGATASAQLGGILKKVPKAPSVPGVTTPTTSTEKPLDINDAMIDKAIKAHAVRQKVYDDEMLKARAKTAEAKAKTAQADALRQKCAQGTMSALMQNSDCKDKFKEKDPRTKEINRLENLVAAANDRGDEAKAEELGKKLDPLSDALEIEADRACGGQGSSKLHDCIERKTAELSKQGLAGPMLQVQAQAACMSDPSTNGVPGATGCPETQPLDADAQKLNAEAQEMTRGANEKADKAEADAMGLDDQQHGKFIDCVIGVLNDDPVANSQTTPEGRAAIHKRADELRKVVH